jgi:transcription-repair coupling factor (superfamily II helicase)
MNTLAPAARLVPGKPLTVSGVPDGFEGVVVADLARSIAARAKTSGASLLVLCRDAERLAALQRALMFFAPEIELLAFPAWDCLPYDRVSPNAAVSARRVATLARLASGRTAPGAIVLSTINAALQRVPSREHVAARALTLAPGQIRPMSDIVHWLETNGFSRSSTVRDVGEYAVRGGIVDLYAPGADVPVRLDFFGEELETIRSFDPESQRTTAQLKSLDLVPTSEVQLEDEARRRFRMNYAAEFGGATKGDPLPDAVNEGRRYPGMEHWLPLFVERLETLFDHLPGVPVVFEPLIEEAARERLVQIDDYYGARKEALEALQQPVYRPLPPGRLYLSETEWSERINAGALVRLSPFGVPDEKQVIEAGGKPGRNFAPERTDESKNVFDAAVSHARALREQGKRVVFAAWSEGSRERLGHVLADRGLTDLRPVATWSEAAALPKESIGIAVLGLEAGFESDNAAVISEQDVLGDRLVRPHRRQRRAQDFIAERSAHRTIALRSTTRAMTVSSCRSKTLSYFRVTAPMKRARSSIVSAEWAGRAARLA